MKRFFVLAISVVSIAILNAQITSQEVDSMYNRFKLGSVDELNSCLKASVPVQYVLPEEYEGKAIIEKEVETFYSGKKTLRMQQAEHHHCHHATGATTKTRTKH